MKKIVQDVEEVTIQSVTTDKYYGVYFGSGRRCAKGFISRESYFSGKYRVICLDGLTFGNGWSHNNKASLILTIQSCLKEGFEAFEFDTAKELMTWLSKD